MLFTPKAPWKNYAWQLFAIGFCSYGFLWLFKGTDHVDMLWALGLSSLISSTYIVFTSPSSGVVTPITIAGGYFVNMACGAMTHFTLSKTLPGYQLFQPDTLMWFSLAMAVSILVTIAITIFLGVKHPPAVAVFIVFVIDLHRYYIFAVIAIGAMILAILRSLLDKHLKDL